MRDDAHAIDAEQDRPAVGLRIERLVQRQEGRHQRVGMGLVGRVAAQRVEQCGDDAAERSLEGLQDHVAGESIGDHHVDVIGHQIAAFDVADEVDARRSLEEREDLFAQQVSLARLLADREESDLGIVDAEPVCGVDGTHLRELHQPLRLHFGVGARVQHDRRGRAGHRDHRCDRGSIDTLDPTHPQQRRGHGRTRVPGRDHRARPAVAHRLSGAHQRRVLLPTDAVGRVVVHCDHLGRLDQVEVTATLEAGAADENNRNTEGRSLQSAGDDLTRSLVAAHGVDCDGQHGRYRQHRRQPTSTTARFLYQPHV